MVDTTGPTPKLTPMTLAVVWHYWIAVLLVIPTVLLVIATAIGYVVKVLGPKYSGRAR